MLEPWAWSRPPGTTVLHLHFPVEKAGAHICSSSGQESVSEREIAPSPSCLLSPLESLGAVRRCGHTHHGVVGIWHHRSAPHLTRLGLPRAARAAATPRACPSGRSRLTCRRLGTENVWPWTERVRSEGEMIRGILVLPILLFYFSYFSSLNPSLTNARPKQGQTSASNQNYEGKITKLEK